MNFDMRIAQEAAQSSFFPLIAFAAATLFVAGADSVAAVPAAGVTAFESVTEEQASADAASMRDQILARITRELSEKFDGARAEIIGEVALPWDGKDRALHPVSIRKVSYLSDDAKGTARFLLEAAFRLEDGSEAVRRYAARVPFAAWVQAPVATRRIRPTEALGRDMFRIENVNIATGRAREFRGLIVPVDTRFEELEATQTILEGYYPLMNGVQKIPLVRRGEPVRLRLVSGVLQLMTTGMAQEPGLHGDTVRVTAEKTKKQLTGVIQQDGTVEVKL